MSGDLKMTINPINPIRLKDRMTTRRIGQAELARQIGVSQPAVFKLLAGTQRWSVRLQEIARILRTTEAYLTDQTDDPTAEQLDVLELLVLDRNLRPDGHASIDSTVAVDKMIFSRTYLRLLTSGSLSQMAFFTGVGDAMYPTIHDRDGLLVDLADTTPTEGDKIWALRHYGHAIIRRLRPSAGGYQILCDNTNIVPDRGDAQCLEIVGRVVAVVKRV